MYESFFFNWDYGSHIYNNKMTLFLLCRPYTVTNYTTLNIIINITPSKLFSSPSLSSN